MSDRDIQTYPIPASSEITDRNYRDEAAAQLFRDSGGLDLTKAVSGLHRALGKQAGKLEEFIRHHSLNKMCEHLSPLWKLLSVGVFCLINGIV